MTIDRSQISKAEEEAFRAMPASDALRIRLRRDEAGFQRSCTHSLGIDQCSYCGAPMHGPTRPTLKLVEVLR